MCSCEDGKFVCIFAVCITAQGSGLWSLQNIRLRNLVFSAWVGQRSIRSCCRCGQKTFQEEFVYTLWLVVVVGSSSAWNRSSEIWSLWQALSSISGKFPCLRLNGITRSHTTRVPEKSSFVVVLGGQSKLSQIVVFFLSAHSWSPIKNQFPRKLGPGLRSLVYVVVFGWWISCFGSRWSWVHI